MVTWDKDFDTRSTLLDWKLTLEEQLKNSSKNANCVCTPLWMTQFHVNDSYEWFGCVHLPSKASSIPLAHTIISQHHFHGSDFITIKSDYLMTVIFTANVIEKHRSIVYSFFLFSSFHSNFAAFEFECKSEFENWQNKAASKHVNIKQASNRRKFLWNCHKIDLNQHNFISRVMLHMCFFFRTQIFILKVTKKKRQERTSCVYTFRFQLICFMNLMVRKELQSLQIVCSLILIIPFHMHLACECANSNGIQHFYGFM